MSGWGSLDGRRFRRADQVALDVEVGQAGAVRRRGPQAVWMPVKAAAQEGRRVVALWLDQAAR